MDIIEVSVVDTLSEYQGHIVIATLPSQTVGSLIQSFCAKRGISRRPEFSLSTRRDEVLPNRSKVSECGIQSGDELYLIINEIESWPCDCNQWWLLSVVCLFIGVCGIVAISVIAGRRNSNDFMYTYGVGLDAGSSHTQLYVYRWLTAKDNGTGVVSEIFTCPADNETKSAAINSFTTDPSIAGSSLRPCLDKAKTFLDANDWSRSPVFLGATAGMRLLVIKNKSLSDEIMSSVRKTISEYPFNSSQLEKQVRIIDGYEEGSFAWISTNYLSGTLGIMPMSRVKSRTVGLLLESVDDRPTIGALDLGGASTQIAFSPRNRTNETSAEHDLNLYGNPYNIYTQSYLCYGINEIIRKHRAALVQSHNFSADVTDPCAPKGNHSVHSSDEIFNQPCTPSYTSAVHNFTFSGSSNGTQCREYILQLFNGTRAQCINHPCINNGSQQPAVYGNFSAFSGYYYTLKFLNHTDNWTLRDFTEAKDTYCNKTWKEVSVIPLRQGESAVEACFRANYVYALLIDAYQFNETSWRQITFTNQVNGASLGWILGMMVNTTNMIPATVSPTSEVIGIPLFILLVVLFVIFIALSVGFACHARHVRSSGVAGRSDPSSTPVLSSSSYGAIDDRQPLGV